MPKRLRDKVAIVTGASKGIGKAITAQSIVVDGGLILPEFPLRLFE